MLHIGDYRFKQSKCKHECKPGTMIATLFPETHFQGHTGPHTTTTTSSVFCNAVYEHLHQQLLR